MVLKGSNFVPRGHMAMSEDIFDGHNLKGATGIQRGGAKDAAKIL